MGKKFSRRIRAGRSRDLPTDNKLAPSPRNRFYDLTSAPGVPVVGRGQRAALSGRHTAASLPWCNRRSRRFSSRFQHSRSNGSQPLDICTSRLSGTRRTSLLNRCFSFHRPVRFRNSRIRHRSALNLRLARLRRLRNRSILRPFRSACPGRSHFFKCECCRGGLFPARLGFVRRWRRGFYSKLFSRLRCLRGRLGFFFAGNDYFLRMYFPDENDAKEYCRKKSFQHDAAR